MQYRPYPDTVLRLTRQRKINLYVYLPETRIEANVRVYRAKLLFERHYKILEDHADLIVSVGNRRPRTSEPVPAGSRRDGPRNGRLRRRYLHWFSEPVVEDLSTDSRKPCQPFFDTLEEVLN